MASNLQTKTTLKKQDKNNESRCDSVSYTHLHFRKTLKFSIPIQYPFYKMKPGIIVFLRDKF